jgi:hypothetical protein
MLAGTIQTSYHIITPHHTTINYTTHTTYLWIGARKPASRQTLLGSQCRCELQRVCMRVSIHIWVYINPYECVCTHKNSRVHSLCYLHGYYTNLSTHTHTHTHTRKLIHTCTHTHTPVAKHESRMPHIRVGVSTENGFPTPKNSSTMDAASSCVCVCVCVCVCKCACMCICIYIYVLCVCVYLCVNVYLYTCVYMFICICVCVCVYVYMCVYAYLNICVFVYVCAGCENILTRIQLYMHVMSVHTQAHIHMSNSHTHTHARTFISTCVAASGCVLVS